MTEKKELHFEISNSGNLVRMEPLERINYHSDDYYDNNWIKTRVTLIGGRFSGQYIADFLTRDFEVFESQLAKLYDNLKGNATFYDLENYLELKILGDGFGHFNVNVRAYDNPGNGAGLTFQMEFDQTQIKLMTTQLRKILEQFPVIGNAND